jgi:hypothetical protein
MKKLYLHIGLGKTGSSAIQSWLSLNTDSLSDQGIDYADLVPQAKQGVATSGNGHILVRAFRDNDFDEVEKLICETYFYSEENQVAIVSSENLHDVRLPKLKKMQEICAHNGIEISVIAYIRSVYERAYSSYVQSVKRTSVTHEFCGEDVFSNFSRTVANLKKYATLFPDNMVLMNYDDPDKDIYAYFSDATGIALSKMAALESRVNRSLVSEELEVIRTLNTLHEGKFSTAISNHVISLSPNTPASIHYDDALIEKVRAETAEDLQWINQHFKLEPKVLADRYNGHRASCDSQNINDLYCTIAAWAASYSPAPEK